VISRRLFGKNASHELPHDITCVEPRRHKVLLLRWPDMRGRKAVRNGSHQVKSLEVEAAGVEPAS
jgi:hypothetical protein